MLFVIFGCKAAVSSVDRNLMCVTSHSISHFLQDLLDLEEEAKSDVEEEEEVSICCPILYVWNKLV